MPSRWVEYIKEWAAKHKISYGCALSDKDMQAAYHLKYPKPVKVARVSKAQAKTKAKKEAEAQATIKSFTDGLKFFDTIDPAVERTVDGDKRKGFDKFQALYDEFQKVVEVNNATSKDAEETRPFNKEQRGQLGVILEKIEAIGDKYGYFDEEEEEEPAPAPAKAASPPKAKAKTPPPAQVEKAVDKANEEAASLEEDKQATIKKISYLHKEYLTLHKAKYTTKVQRELDRVEKEINQLVRPILKKELKAGYYSAKIGGVDEIITFLVAPAAKQLIGYSNPYLIFYDDKKRQIKDLTRDNLEPNEALLKALAATYRYRLFNNTAGLSDAEDVKKFIPDLVPKEKTKQIPEYMRTSKA
jgi:hypothetical protein